MKKRRFLSIAGYAILFVTIAVIITVAIMVFDAVGRKFGGDKAVLSVVMLIKITVDRPVEWILEATQRIAAGDFSVRLQISHSYRRYDEYDLIAENINRMAGELSRTEVVHNDFISNVSHAQLCNGNAERKFRSCGSEPICASACIGVGSVICTGDEYSETEQTGESGIIAAV